MKNQKGMTIVEVLAAFVILLLAAAAFTACLVTAGHIMDTAEEIRQSVGETASANAGSRYSGAVYDGSAQTYTFTYGSLPSIQIPVRGGACGGVAVFLPPE